MPAVTLRLENCRILVVGAGTQPSDEPDPPVGNGRAIAVAAAREGAHVVCVDRDRGAAEATAEWVEREGGTASVIEGDVASEESCIAFVARSGGERSRRCGAERRHRSRRGDGEDDRR